MKRSKGTEPSEPRPEGYRQSMHLALDSADLDNLDKIIAMMKRDPILGRLKAGLGREKATRFAIAYCVEHLPARITTVG